jgi:TPR repeat protein
VVPIATQHPPAPANGNAPAHTLPASAGPGISPPIHEASPATTIEDPVAADRNALAPKAQPTATARSAADKTPPVVRDTNNTATQTSNVSPQAAAAPNPPAPLSAEEIAALVARGDVVLGTGDIISARLFYERAASAGDGHAALLTAETFDPAFLDRAGVRGVQGDQSQAEFWYRRARDLGDRDAQRRFQLLDRQK